MKPYDPPPDAVLVLLSPTATFDERKRAMLRLSADAWGRGWDECDEEYREALTKAGLLFNLDIAVARA